MRNDHAVCFVIATVHECRILCGLHLAHRRAVRLRRSVDPLATTTSERVGEETTRHSKTPRSVHPELGLASIT